MLIVMRHGATDAEVQRVVAVIEEMGYRAHPMPGSQRTAVGLVGNDGRVVPAGVYLYKLTARGVIQFRRIVFRGRNR